MPDEPRTIDAVSLYAWDLFLKIKKARNHLETHKCPACYEAWEELLQAITRWVQGKEP